MQLIDNQLLTNTQSQSALAFTTTGGATWPEWERFISLGDEQLFHIGNICGTCEFFFRRMIDRPISSFALEQIRRQLEHGLRCIDETAMTSREIIPNGNYVVALFTAQPRLVGTDQVPDYFSHEQRLAWRGYEDVASTPSTGYFRGESRPLKDREMLFEFFVPLYDLSLLNEQRVAQYKRVLLSGMQPTAVSLSVLDVKSSMSFPENGQGEEVEPAFRTHWCFANYLLDGHHKVYASQATGRPITMLSFISLDHSWKLVDELIAAYEKDRW